MWLIIEPHDADKYLRLGIRHKYDTLVSECVAHMSKADARVASSALDNGTPGLNEACAGKDE